MTKFKETAIEPFLDALASSKATPGGGSAAAIIGAMGAALVSMVCNLTIGKKKYANVEGEMKEVLHKAEALRHKLTGMIEDDVKERVLTERAKRLTPRDYDNFQQNLILLEFLTMVREWIAR